MKSLKSIRLEAKITIRKLANMIGVSRQTIVNYEADVCMPNEKVWKKLQNVLKITSERGKFFRKRKSNILYTKNSKCKVAGCKKIPRSNGLCINHYISYWRKHKKTSEK